MNYRRFRQLSDTFGLFIQNLHGFYFDSLKGYQLISKYLNETQDTVADSIRGFPEAEVGFQDTCSLPHSHIAKPSSELSWLYVPTQGDLKTRNDQGGENEWRLGNYCVVIAYSYWECHLRREIALALEVLDPDESDRKKVEKILNTHVSSVFWGNLGYFRNSILHANGKASSKSSASRLFHWFKPGEEVRIDETKMRTIFLAMVDYRNALESRSRTSIAIQI